MTLYRHYAQMPPERLWLSTVCIVPRDGSDGHDQELDWISRLFAFALVTETITLARLCKHQPPTYEIIFIFVNLAHRDDFLALVNADGFADPYKQGTFEVPCRAKIQDALSVPEIFPEEQAECITGCRCYRNMYGGN